MLPEDLGPKTLAEDAVMVAYIWNNSLEVLQYQRYSFIVNSPISLNLKCFFEARIWPFLPAFIPVLIH
jgi:hypothetical protein